MSTKGIQKIFLSYANTPLLDDAEQIYGLFETIKNCSSEQQQLPTKSQILVYTKDWLPSDLDQILREIVELSNEGEDKGRIRNASMNAIAQGPMDYDLKRRNIAFGAVYGYLDIDCSICYYNSLSQRRQSVIDLYGQNLLRGPNRLKCYECDQIHFLWTLDQLINYPESGDILGLFDYRDAINCNAKSTVSTVQIKKESPPVSQSEEERDFCPSKNFYDPRKNPSIISKYLFIESYAPSRLLQKSRFFQNKSDDIRDTPNLYKYSFSNLTVSIFGYSLIQFLENNDRRRLKRCDFCKTIYFASKVNQKYCKICSPKCKMTRDKRRHYQRVYREKQRNKVKEVQQRKLEKEIAKMMSLLEISKKEAMELIEFDRDV